MRYLGNKESLVNEIETLLNEKDLLNRNLSFFDAFCGTGAVANHLSPFYNDIKLNDNLNWAVIYSKGRLVASDCLFDKLNFDPIEFFNSNQEIYKGFFYENYSPGNSQRMYFSEYNAGRIDFFRMTIEEWWKEDNITENEYYYLLACLVESVSKVANVAGVYGAYLKHWDSRALKEITFEKVSSQGVSGLNIESYASKIEDKIEDIECDILYLDPPYTQNQYGTQYHLLETLILNDNPEISKITGSRSTTPMRSDWSKNYKSHILFDYILANTKARYVIFSYNNAGLMSKKFIESSLKRYGIATTYICKKISYKKYQNWKSKNNEDHFEYLFFIELKDKKDVRFESPLNYTGSKSKIINEIINNSPTESERIVDAFGGGFNVGINFSNQIVYNEINFFVKELIESFQSNDTYDYLKYIQKMTKKFGLERGNKEAYNYARSYYNSLPTSKKDPRLLFTIILYGFNQQIRFNNSHEFNNPSGIRWFNDRMLEKMISFSRVIKIKDITFSSRDYSELTDCIDSKTFLYLDPPYMLTTGSYNDGKRGFNGWDTSMEKQLFSFLNAMNKKEIKFMLSYVIEHKGEVNGELINWISENDYRVIELGDVTGISGSKRKEVLIVNYDK
ncbi:DNA adenine methylase [Aerococcus urinaeequi]|uniref:DNA adenine methylase n=1 Tax=Aerococcus urinaeequi TaxID=51665 RepID=UPI003D6BD084